MWGYGLDRAGLGWRQVAGTCECGNESSIQEQRGRRRYSSNPLATSATEGGGWTETRTNAFTLEKISGTHFIGYWVGLAAGLQGHRKSCPHRDSITGPSSL
jgi:hypothetical protein